MENTPAYTFKEIPLTKHFAGKWLLNKVDNTGLENYILSSTSSGGCT